MAARKRKKKSRGLKGGSDHHAGALRLEAGHVKKLTDAAQDFMRKGECRRAVTMYGKAEKRLGALEANLEGVASSQSDFNQLLNTVRNARDRVAITRNRIKACERKSPKKGWE